MGKVKLGMVRLSAEHPAQVIAIVARQLTRHRCGDLRIETQCKQLATTSLPSAEA